MDGQPETVEQQLAAANNQVAYLERELALYKQAMKNCINRLRESESTIAIVYDSTPRRDDGTAQPSN